MLPVITRTDRGWNMTWDAEAELLEIDLLDTGLVEWFWRSRLNNETDGNETPECGFSDAFKYRANRFQVTAPSRASEGE